MFYMGRPLLLHFCIEKTKENANACNYINNNKKSPHSIIKIPLAKPKEKVKF